MMDAMTSTTFPDRAIAPVETAVARAVNAVKHYGDGDTIVKSSGGLGSPPSWGRPARASQR